MADTIDIASQAAQGAGHTVGDAIGAYQMHQHLEQQKQELEQKKQQNLIAKANWVSEQYTKIGRFSGPAQATMIDQFGKQMQMIEPGFNPDILQVLKKDPDVVRKMAWGAGYVLSRGGIPNEEAAQTLLDGHNGDIEAYYGSATKLGEEQAKIQAAQLGVTQVKREMLEETKNQHAGQVGQAYETNPIIKNSKIKLNAMNQSSAILENPDKPVLARDFNAAYQDYLAGTAPGGVPTEGKASREIPDTFELEKNKFLSKFGDNQDLRSSKTGRELLDLLTKNIKSSKRELGMQIGSQAEDLHSSYLTSTNEKALETNKTKLKQYNPEAYNRLYGGGKGQAAAAPQPATPAPQAAAPPVKPPPKQGDVQYDPKTGKTYKVIGDHWVEQR